MVEEALTEEEQNKVAQEPDDRDEQVVDTLWDTGNENQKILTWAYLALGGVAWLVLGSFFNFVISWLFNHVFVDTGLAITLERSPIQPGFVLGVLVALALGMFCRSHVRINGFGLEVVAEIRKMIWSPFDVVAKSTVAVIITICICAVILGAFDLLFGKLATLLLE